MAFEPIPGLSLLLGLVAWGDIGETTVYKTKRKKVVWLAKTYPNKPASTLQLERRATWAAASAAWNDLTAAQRAQWELTSRRASLCMHGFNLWMHWKITADHVAIKTLERQTHTTLLAA